MSTALVDWTPLDGRDVPPVPAGPLLVRAPDGAGWHHYVAELKAGLWRINGAPDRTLYGATHWARIVDSE